MQGQTPSVKVWDAAGRFRAGVLICIVVVVVVESEPAQKAWQVMFLSKTSIYKDIYMWLRGNATGKGWDVL